MIPLDSGSSYLRADEDAVPHLDVPADGVDDEREGPGVVHEAAAGLGDRAAAARRPRRQGAEALDPRHRRTQLRALQETLMGRGDPRAAPLPISASSPHPVMHSWWGVRSRFQT